MILQVQAVEDTFESLGRQLGDMMDEMTQRAFYQFSRSVTWQPTVNLYEDENQIYLCADLAGLARDQIQVDVTGNKIVIRGNRPAPTPPDVEGPTCILRMEINSGPFERIIELSDQADMDTADAKLIDGFLWIVIVKKPG